MYIASNRSLKLAFGKTVGGWNKDGYEKQIYFNFFFSVKFTKGGFLLIDIIHIIGIHFYDFEIFRIKIFIVLHGEKRFLFFPRNKQITFFIIFRWSLLFWKRRCILNIGR